MKSYSNYILAIFLFWGYTINCQNITYEFSNAQITNVGANDSYEVDVMISSTTDFKLGSGQLYFDYNPLAFGNSIETNGMVTITTTGHTLGETSGPFGIYTSFITNDNTSSRLSFSWQQALSSGCISTNNATGVPTSIFHLRIDFIAGGSSVDPEVCFTSVPPFDDQTFTACGPEATCTFPDCVDSPGMQLTDDNFDCSAYLPLPLPIIMSFFTARLKNEKEVELDWETEVEINNDYFQIERSQDGYTFENIGEVSGAGSTSRRSSYQYLDFEPNKGINYYRLKQVDYDGTYEYSEIRAVEVDVDVNLGEVSVYPNPASEFITVSLEKTPIRGVILLINGMGQAVISQALEEGSTTYTLQVDHLPKGIYWIRIGGDTPEFTSKVVIQ